MAMIVCPHCGEQVSEKAKKCVHCGEILILEEKKHCTECGVELEEGMTECPNCGCPVDDTIGQETDEKPQKVEVTGVKVTKKIKVIIGIVIALLVVGGATVFGVTQYQKKKAAEEYAQRVEEYSDNLNLATVTMLTGASDAESSANLIKQVWYNAIYEKRDDETDKYTRPKGYFVSDFNDALGNLYADSSFSSKVMWNLNPTTKSINSSKSNNLPDWDTYFKKLAQQEYHSYQLMWKNDIVHKEFEKCAKEHINSDDIRYRVYRRGLEYPVFAEELKSIILPVYQSAQNCGFGRWKY